MKAVRAIVKTNARRSEILEYDEARKAYRVEVKAQPEKGKANLAVVKLFSKHFKRPVKIISGFTSKEKLLKIA